MTEQSRSNSKPTAKDLRSSLKSLAIGVPVAVSEGINVLVRKTTAIGKGTVTSYQCTTKGNHPTLDAALEEADELVKERFFQIKAEHSNAYVAVRVNQPSRFGVYHVITTQVTVAHDY